MGLTNKELKNIKAGASISAALMNSVIKGFTTILDVGRYLGSSLRRFYTGNYCQMK